MIKIYTPPDEVQLAILRSLFEAEGVPIHVHNDAFGSLRPGIQIPLLNQKAIMVSEAHLEKGKEILQVFLENAENPEEQPEGTRETYSFLDKLRMVFEALVFGWVMPGRRWARRNESGGQSGDRPNEK